MQSSFGCPVADSSFARKTMLCVTVYVDLPVRLSKPHFFSKCNHTFERHHWVGITTQDEVNRERIVRLREKAAPRLGFVVETLSRYRRPWSCSVACKSPARWRRLVNRSLKQSYSTTAKQSGLESKVLVLFQ
jgi:hypothetical protein